ncbi:hypothetical protein MRX96_034670 [Rhipicephalus microplus]
MAAADAIWTASLVSQVVRWSTLAGQRCLENYTERHTRSLSPAAATRIDGEAIRNGGPKAFGVVQIPFSTLCELIESADARFDGQAAAISAAPASWHPNRRLERRVSLLMSPCHSAPFLLEGARVTLLWSLSSSAGPFWRRGLPLGERQTME